MSRAFVKESDGTPEALPDRAISPHANLVTDEGLGLIDAEIAKLHAARATAYAGDDREGLVRVARDLRYWSARRASAQMLPPPRDDGTVHFGSRVTIERGDGRRQTYRIVGEDEADPASGTLSYVSPVARELLGREVGDVVRAGASEATLVEIG